MSKYLIILIFCALTIQPCFAKCFCQNYDIYKTAIFNNALNLSDEQIELQSLNLKQFKKCLTSDQRIKYNMIKKLEKNEYKKSKKKKKDYYKSNPQMMPFGNPPKCPTNKLKMEK
ncbi:hypothetical protein IJ472_03805 [bacterium]|nr:hypothetical protein [bacterium]